jgi:hypothetical protein
MFLFHYPGLWFVVVVVVVVVAAAAAAAVAVAIAGEAVIFSFCEHSL